MADLIAELARCPFCDFSPVMTGMFGAAMVHCPTCGADGPMKDTKDEAAAAWNYRPHHAELGAAVRDAAYGRALRAAMEAEYKAAKESRKGGKQEAWITTYSLLRRLKVASDHLTDMGNPITAQDQPLAAMRAGEGEG